MAEAREDEGRAYWLTAACQTALAALAGAILSSCAWMLSEGSAHARASAIARERVEAAPWLCLALALAGTATLLAVPRRGEEGRRLASWPLTCLLCSLALAAWWSGAVS